MEMNIVGVGKVEVTMTRTIEVGRSYRINSSYGFAGIDNGIVRVVGLEDPDTMDEVTKRDTVDAWLDTLHGDGSREAEELCQHYKTCMYVAYEYTHGKQDGPIYLPLDLFAEHISMQ